MSTITATTTAAPRDADVARVSAAAIAAIVLIDVAVVRAPYLAMLAVPYVIGAVTYRGKRVVSSVVFALFALLYLAISVNFIVANGIDAIWGDLLFAYGGSLFGLALLVSLVRTVAARRRTTR